MNCPVCSDYVVQPHGSLQSQVLFIRSEVHKDDKHTRVWNDGHGQLLRTELYQMGVDLNIYRHAVLFNHHVKDECHEFCEFMTLQELKDRKLIVLVGAGAVSFFTDNTVSIDDVAGLDISEFIAPRFWESAHFDTKWLAFENPAMAFIKGVGELRFCISQLKKLLEEL